MTFQDTHTNGKNGLVTRKDFTEIEGDEMKKITDSELLGLPFGSRIKVIWHNSTHHPKNDEYYYYGVIFGDKIGYEDGEFDDTRTIAECVFNDWCVVYQIDK